MPTPAPPFRLGPWLVEPSLNRITGAQSSSRLEPKAMEVLLELANRQGDVLTREELLATVWAGTVVTEDVLTRSISSLRKALGDDRKSQHYIETVPKMGYRLVAPISPPSESPRRTVAGASGLREVLRWGGAAVILIGLGVVWIQRSTTRSPTMYQSRALTTYSGLETNGRLSPDGSQIAFAWRGQSGDNLDVYTKLVRGEGLLRLSDAEAYDFRPTWSPDGSRLAFIRWSDECSIYIVSALGGTARQLGPCGDTIYPDPIWSPDGAWIAMNGRESPDEPFAIYLISVATLERRRITNPPGGTWGDHDPSFSPSGDEIAFTRSASEGMQDLFIVGLDDARERQLTDESKNIWGHTWAGPSTIVFSSNRTGRASLWMFDLREQSASWIGVAADDAKFPTWANGRLAFMQSSSDVNIWKVLLADTASAAPVVMSTRWDMHPSFSPDGGTLAFTSNRSGHYEVWVADSSGADEIRLTSFSGPFTSSPRWSPDGRRLVFTSRPDGQANVYLLDADGGVPELLTSDSDGSDELAPSWIQTGDAILFSSNRTGRWEVYRLDLQSRTTTQITREGGLGPQQGHDESIYYAKPGRPGIWRANPDGSGEKRMLGDLDTRDWGSWRVSANAIVYLRRGHPTLVVRHSLRDAGEDTLFIPANEVPSGDPAIDVSQDGTTLLVGQIDRSESDLMLVEGFNSATSR